MSSLPLKLRVGIRDHWEAKDASWKKSVDVLKKVLGHELVVDPQWTVLHVELAAAYPDGTVLVATIAASVDSWCKALTRLLEDESREEWIDTLLENIRTSGRGFQLFIDTTKDSGVSTSWSEDRSGFVLYLPTSPGGHSADLTSVFSEDFLTSFEAKPPPYVSGKAPIDDGWSDFGSVAERPAEAAAGEGSAPARQRVPLQLRPLSTLPRPEELFAKPPYYLTLFDHGNAEIEIHASHSHSLKFIADYLSKWCKVNHKDTRKPQAVDIKLHQSSFGIGVMYDRLTLTTEQRYGAPFTVTAPFLVAFIEGIMGYELFGSSDSRGLWKFRRTQEFV